MEEEHEDQRKNYLCIITIYNYYYTEQIYLTEKEVVKVLFGGVDIYQPTNSTTVF